MFWRTQNYPFTGIAEISCAKPYGQIFGFCISYQGVARDSQKDRSNWKVVLNGALLQG